MNAFEQIVYFLQKEMTTPTNYSTFHIIFIILVVLLTYFLCTKYADADDKTVRKILFISWITMVLFEIYKQIVFSFRYDGIHVVWDFQWYSFPFQMCSSPLYALPFVIFMKEGRTRNGFIQYSAFFALLAGIAVYIYPNDVFIEMIGINIQTMVHHGLQIVTGFYLLFRYRNELSWQRHIDGCMVFTGFILVALLLNVTVPCFITETFNMFYISPIYPCTLPVFSTIYEYTPYIIFLASYLFAFFAGSSILYITADYIFHNLKNN